MHKNHRFNNHNSGSNNHKKDYSRNRSFRKDPNKERIYKDLISVLTRTKEALIRKEFSSLKLISDNIIHNLSIFQHERIVSTAVTIYALSKVMERYFIKATNTDDAKFSKENLETHLEEIVFIIDQSIGQLTDGKTKEYDSSIKAIINLASCYDKKIHFYVEEVIRSSGIKKGARMYEHGISLGRTADLLGVTQWELMQYVGKTGISDAIKEGEVINRYEYAKSLFEN